MTPYNLMNIINICRFLMLSVVLINLPNVFAGSKIWTHDVLLPGVTSDIRDAHICTSWKIYEDTNQYLMKFEQLLNHSSNIYQLSLMATKNLPAEENSQHCLSYSIDSIVLFVWTKNEPSLQMPLDVGFYVSGSSKLNYITVQVRFINPFQEPDYSGVRLTFTDTIPIHLGRIMTFSDDKCDINSDKNKVVCQIVCKLQSDENINSLAYRVDSHSSGEVVSGYVRRGSDWIKIGKNNPQQSHTFWPTNITIYGSDDLVVSCVFNIENKHNSVDINKAKFNEMCKFDLMYYTNSSNELHHKCSKDDNLKILQTLPSMATSLMDDSEKDSSSWDHTIQMPNITTEKEDKYLCIDWTFPFDTEHFLTGYEAKPDNPNVHHMLLFACSGNAKSTNEAFECLGACNNERIYFAWGRNAPPTNLPKDVGFKLASDHVNFLRYQVHYRTIVDKKDQTSLKLTITKTPQLFTAAVLLMVANELTIPAHTKMTIGNVSCKYNRHSISHPFAFRVHAHMLGRVISAYIKKKSGWQLIGKGNPQWPQAFWPILDKDLIIELSDILVAKCVYNSENYPVDVKIGSTHNDEMCNFYIMYYKNSSEVGGPIYCVDDNLPDISKDIPDYALLELPPNPDLEDVGEGHKHHHIHSNMTMENEVNISLNPDSGWPKLPKGVELGDVTGITADQFGYVYIFHRGNNSWMDDSFDENSKYKNTAQPPVKENTILKINISSGDVVKMFGANIFYLPHGIFVDHEGNIWLTDVAMHQVFKYPLAFEDNSKVPPLLLLGEKFIPGFDNSHFCKPTDLVVALTEEIFITDGYCNSRVIVFDRFGNFVRMWKVGESFNSYYLPHSLSLDAVTGRLFVADRVTYSVYIYSLNGKFEKKLTSDEFKPELFSVAFSPSNGKLFCLNGNLIDPNTTYDYHVIVLDVDTGSILSKWSVPEVTSFHGSTHDIATTLDGKYVFVSVVGTPGNVHKFEASKSGNFGLSHKSVKKGGILSYHRRLINKVTPSDASPRFFDDPLKQNIAAAFVVLLCFLVIPLSIVVFVTLYLKKKRRSQHHYSHLEAAHQANRRLPNKIKNFVGGKNQEKDSVHEEELRRLESESDEEYMIPQINNNKL